MILTVQVRQRRLTSLAQLETALLSMKFRGYNACSLRRTPLSLENMLYFALNLSIATVDKAQGCCIHAFFVRHKHKPL